MDALLTKAWETGGVVGVLLIIVSCLVLYQNKVFVPTLLSDHRAEVKELTAIHTAALNQQQASFTMALAEQRADFLAAVNNRDAAETKRNEQQLQAFERHLSSHSVSCQKLAETQSAAITEDLKALKNAVAQNGELLVFAFKEVVERQNSHEEAIEQSREEQERPGGRSLSRQRD
jgi:hypothetical protein